VAAVDATGRLFAEKLQERLKQPVVVENRPAGGGMVGADSVAKAAPDGHTLLLMETSSVLHRTSRRSHGSRRRR
jgi:tripartite-type tricarboxylate transporter receptor subunit TctC